MSPGQISRNKYRTTLRLVFPGIHRSEQAEYGEQRKIRQIPQNVDKSEVNTVADPTEVHGAFYQAPVAPPNRQLATIGQIFWVAYGLRVVW